MRRLKNPILMSLIVVPLLMATSAHGQMINYAGEKAAVHCNKPWTKRGEKNVRMFNYCMKKQQDGFKNLAVLYKKMAGEVNWTDKALKDISKSWIKRGIPQYNMIHYQLNNQYESFLDLKYAKKNKEYPDAKFQKCENHGANFDFANRHTQIMYCLKHL